MLHVIAGVVIEQDNKVLLVQEKNPKAYKLWNFPAGYVDEGESPEKAAIREAEEETGYKVTILKQLFELKQTEKERILVAYYAKIIGGKLKVPNNEIFDAKWIGRDSIGTMRDELRNPEYIIGALKELTSSADRN